MRLYFEILSVAFWGEGGPGKFLDMKICTFLFISGAGGVGFSDLMHNHAAYQRRLRTTSKRAAMHQKLLEMCDLKHHFNDERSTEHHQTTRAEIKRGEAAVRRAESAIEGFMDPFDPPPEVNPDFLYRISSGCPVPTTIEKDIFRAGAAGKAAQDRFVRERLNPDTRFKPFYAPVRYMKIKTMGDIKVPKKSSSKAGMRISGAEQSEFFVQTLTN